MYGYLSRTKHKHYAIRFRTKEPDYQHLPEQEFDWSRTVYGNVTEELHKDTPEPLGKHVITTTFLDANLWHVVNTTPTNLYSKMQATVENATYGSEFVAAKTATEQIIVLRQTVRYLGVPIKSKAFMFGDNKSVVTSSTIPHFLLNKRHNMLPYH